MDACERKVFLFGASASGITALNTIAKNCNVIGFVDNDKSKWGKALCGHTIHSPNILLTTEFDTVIISTTIGYMAVTEQLLLMGVERAKINTEHVIVPIKSRILFLEKLGELIKEKGIGGSVAEGGVFQGEFAKEINRVFPSKKFYLFDTFSGFDAKDVAAEHENQYSNVDVGHLSITSEELVTSKMHHPKMCVVRKGYFPESAEGINDVFCFVNLDFDLYQPTLAGLEYFAPRMISGGVILIHDYFSDNYKGVKDAVVDYVESHKGTNLIPIGDGISIAIQF